jgi:hypothetical protein
MGMPYWLEKAEAGMKGSNGLRLEGNVPQPVRRPRWHSGEWCENTWRALLTRYILKGIPGD